ncbi:MAG: glycosyltransferase family 2 protein [Deltaproteobacteria bacterium]|nr:glycosyltransferase family 2 protein [Deltaproteobacteria bacterium]
MSDLPMVSVVIPMRNEAASIGALLESVLAQDYPADRLEVLVVDGDSDDGSAAVVDAVAARDPRVRRLQNPKRIVPPALNIAIRAARGTIIARVDGHTRLAPDYLRIGVETLARSGADNVGGRMDAVGGGWFGDAVADATASPAGVGSYFHFGTEERDVDTVYLGMWPRSVFERVGLFDEELVRNQDDEFNYRLRKLGGRVRLNPAMRSWYQNRQDVAHLLRQYYQYGQWKVRVLQKHPAQMSWRHFVPPAFVAGMALLAILAAEWTPFAWLLRAVTALYLVLIAAAAWRQSRARGLRGVLGTGVALICVHVAWGAGFLSGLIRFADRWRQPEQAPPRLERTGEAAA